MSSVPPLSISGSASRAMRMNEWQEMSIARAKPSRERVGDAAVQVVGRRVGDRVQHEVEPAPALADRVEDRFHRAGLLDVERHRDRRGQLARQRLDVGPCLVVEPGHRELGAAVAEHAGAAVGDAVLVGDADHQALAAAEQRLRTYVDFHRFLHR